MLHPALSQSQVDAFCDNLKLFKLGYSWGGPISLVVPYNIASMRSHLPLHLQQGFLVRFSTGFEEPQDLIKDLAIAANQCLNF
jgi:cystathionine beta-lyase